MRPNHLGIQTGGGIIAFSCFVLLTSCKCDDLRELEKSTTPPKVEEPVAVIEEPDPVDPIPEKPEAETSPDAALPEFEEASKFVRHCLLAAEEKDLDYLMGLYAEDVDYFGNERTASWVRDNIAEYRKKWPTRSEWITSTVFRLRTDENRWDVTFNTSFNFKAPGRKDWMNGTKSHEYTVIRKQGRFFITGQTAEYRHTIGPDGEHFPAEDLAEGSHTSAELRKKAKKSKYPQNAEAGKLILKVRKAELERNIEGVMAAYAPSVKYFGRKMTREELFRHKVEDFMNWPKIEDLQTSYFTGNFEASPLLKITFDSKFKKSNELEGTWESGVMANSFIFAEVDGKMLIVEQSGKITGQKKSSK